MKVLTWSEDEKYNEMLDLMNIPEFKHLMLLRSSQLQREFPDIIEQYQKIKGEFKQVAYGHMLVCMSEKETIPHAYYFELKGGSRNTWRVIAVDPQPPQGVTFDDIIHPNIAQQIGISDIDYNEIRMFKPGITVNGKLTKFEVRYTKFSDVHAIGSIKKIGPRTGEKKLDRIWESRKAEERRNPVGKNGCLMTSPPKRKRDDHHGVGNLGALKWFLYYFRKNPQVARQLLQDFRLRIEPSCESEKSR